MQATTSYAPRRAALWLASLPVIAALAVVGVHLINGLVGGYVAKATEKRSFRIMTWNIGKLYLRWDSRAADRDLQHVARVIRQAAPHVVALQELKTPEQLGRLVAALGPGWRGHLPEDVYDRRAGLLVNGLATRFVGLTTSTGRTAQAAVITLDQGHQLCVVSLHLDAFDAKRRRLQAEEVLAASQKLGAGHLFMAGDFNLDPAVAAQGSVDRRLYSFLASEMVDAAKYAGPTSVLSRRLDYIFFRSRLVRAVSSQVLRNQRINLMDHDPVVAEFRL